MRQRRLRIFGLCLFLVLFVGAGCKKKPPPVTPPPPPPPPAAAPTASMTVNPTSIERGQTATLEWSTTGATAVTIEPGVGNVPPSGNRQVRPTESTTYRLTAKGEGGTTPATARVTVTAPPPVAIVTPPTRRDPTEEELFNQNVRTIYFDYDKYELRDDQRAAAQGNGEFFRSHPRIRVVIEGHCDERGSSEYNLGLGDRRANTVKEFLVSLGISADRMRTISYGKEKPACTESTEECWQRNRRAQFVMER